MLFRSLDPNAGKIVVVSRLATTGSPDVVARYNTNGSLDTSFARGAGYETLSNLNNVPSVAIQADGRIIVAGNHGNGPMELDRLNTDGSFDANFGSGGIVTVNPANTYYSARDVTIASDGKIQVAGGTVNTNTAFFVARFNSADGSLDTGFGAGGVAVASGSDLFFGTVGMALEPDGGIVVAGSQTPGGGALARFLA